MRLPPKSGVPAVAPLETMALTSCLHRRNARTNRPLSTTATTATPPNCSIGQATGCFISCKAPWRSDPIRTSCHWNGISSVPQELCLGRWQNRDSIGDLRLMAIPQHGCDLLFWRMRLAQCCGTTFFCGTALEWIHELLHALDSGLMAVDSRLLKNATTRRRLLSSGLSREGRRWGRGKSRTRRTTLDEFLSSIPLLTHRAQPREAKMSFCGAWVEVADERA